MRLLIPQCRVVYCVLKVLLYACEAPDNNLIDLSAVQINCYQQYLRCYYYCTIRHLSTSQFAKQSSTKSGLYGKCKRNTNQTERIRSSHQPPSTTSACLPPPGGPTPPRTDARAASPRRVPDRGPRRTVAGETSPSVRLASPRRRRDGQTVAPPAGDGCSPSIASDWTNPSIQRVTGRTLAGGSTWPPVYWL